MNIPLFIKIGIVIILSSKFGFLIVPISVASEVYINNYFLTYTKNDVIQNQDE